MEIEDKSRMGIPECPWTAPIWSMELKMWPWKPSSKARFDLLVSIRQFPSPISYVIVMPMQNAMQERKGRRGDGDDGGFI